MAFWTTVCEVQDDDSRRFLRLRVFLTPLQRLGVDHLCERAATVDQLVVAAAFDELSCVEDVDNVRVTDSRQSMCDHDDRCLPLYFLKELIDTCFEFGIESARGFIENKQIELPIQLTRIPAASARNNQVEAGRRTNIASGTGLRGRSILLVAVFFGVIDIATS